MATTDVKQLLLQVDASVELLRRNMLAGERVVDQSTQDMRRSLDAADRRFGQFGRPLGGLSATVQQTNRRIASIGTSVEAVERQMRASSAGIRTALLASTAGIGAAFGANQLKEFADGYTRYTNQLKVAGLEGSGLVQVQDGLFATAQKYGVELESLGALYGRTSQGAKELGASQGDLLKFANGVAASIKVQGGAASEAKGALQQLSQALGGQIVRAEEYNSINEGARPILQAVANGSDRFKGSVNALRTAVLAGTVTSKEFFAAALKGFPSIEAQAAKSNLTIGASFTVLNNAFGRYIGETDSALSATARVSAGITGLADNLDTVVPALTTIAVAYGAKSLLGGLQAFATTAVISFNAAAAGAEAATLTEAQYAAGVARGNVVMLGSVQAVADRAAATAAAAATEVAEIEATIAMRRADAIAIAANTTLIERQRFESLQAQAQLKANAALGFGTLGVTRSQPDAARANQDLKTQIANKRALAVVNAQLAESEAALAAAQARATIATEANTVAQAQATLAARAGAVASRLLAGAYALVGGAVGLTALAIAAAVGAILYFRAETHDATAEATTLAENTKILNAHMAELATLSTGAATGINAAGAAATSATGKMLSFAGAVGEAAQKLQQLAITRRNEQYNGFVGDFNRANADAAAVKARIDQRRARLNGGGSRSGLVSRADQEADAADMIQFNAAIRNREAARQSAGRAKAIPLEARITASERNGGRDVPGELARITNDLKIASARGDKREINRLRADQYELKQYQAYRKGGASDESAKATASADAERLRSAGSARLDDQDSARSRRDLAKANRGAAAVARRQETAVRDAAADTRAFAAAERTANDDIAKARADLTGSAVERAAIEKRRIEGERTSRNEELEQQAIQGRFGTGAEGKSRLTALQAKNDERASLETQVVDLEERRRVEKDALDIATAGLGNQQDLLRAQSNLATTATQKRDLELRILDIQYQEQAARLRAVTVANGATEAEEKIAKARLALLPQLQKADQEGVRQQTRGVGEQYLADLDATDVNEQLDQVRVNGLGALENGLAGVVTGTQSVKGAFKSMASSILSDLARIAIQKYLISAIAPSIFGGFADGGLPAFADGGLPTGLIRGPGTGRSDSIIARVSNREFIMNAQATADNLPVLEAMNKGRIRAFANGGPVSPSAVFSPRVPVLSGTGARGGQTVHQSFDLRGAVVTEKLYRDMSAISQSHAMAAAQVGAQLGSADAQKASRRSYLPGSVG